MPLPICCKCNKEMKTEKNGVGLIELASFGDYKLYRTDKVKCPVCGIEVLTGFSEPIAHHETCFASVVDDAKKKEHYTF